MKFLTTVRIFDLFLIGIVFLNFTNFYTFLSGLTGLSFKVVGGAFILFMVCYCVANLSLLKRFLSAKPVPWFLLLFVVIPIVTVVYAPYRELRFIGYTVNFGMIFLVTGIWILKWGWVRFSKVIILSWICCIFGILMSYFAPDVFEQVAIIQEQAAGGGGAWSDTRIGDSSQARAFGFYMQSNRAAHAVMMHLLVLLPFIFHNRSYIRILVLGISFGAILLTGSRGGFLIVSGFSVLMLFYELKNGVRTKSGVVSGLTALPRYIILSVLSLLITLLVFSISIYNNNMDAGDSAVTRIYESLFASGYNLIDDISVQSRIQAQVVFVERILERPILGRGHFSILWDKYQGSLPIAAHNMYVDLAYEYGIPLATGCYIYLFYLMLCREARVVAEYFRFNPLFMFVAVLCVHTFVSNTTFDLRIFPAVVAFLLVMLFFRGGGSFKGGVL